MFDPKAEAMSTDERAALQRHRLWGLVDRLLAADGVQGRRLKEAGVAGGADVTLADLPALPFTTKQDLWDNYPFGDRKSTRLNSSHVKISYAVFCLKKKKKRHAHDDGAKRNYGAR